MKSIRNPVEVLFALVPMLLVLVGASLRADPPKVSEVKTGQVIIKELTVDGGVVGTLSSLDPAGDDDFGKPSKYVLGVVLQPLAPALRAQLGIEEGQGGMVVEHVLADSPAKRAGIEKYDILLRCDGKKIASVKDIASALEKAGGKEVTVEIVRAGQKKKVKVQPDKRGKADKVELRADKIDILSDRIELAGKPFKFHVVQPGMVLKRKGQELPEGMAVAITKHGSEPARIVVEKGEKRWETTAEHLEKLPEDIQKHVEAMLGGSAFPGNFFFKAMQAFVTPAPTEKGAGSVRILQGESDQVFRVEVEVNEDGVKTQKVRKIQSTPLPAKKMQPKISRPVPIQTYVRKVQSAADKEPAAMKHQMEELQKKLDRRFEEMNRKMEKLQKALEKLAERETSREGPF